MPLKRYADFQGRSRRKEYWMFFLGYLIVTILLAVFGGIFGSTGDGASGLFLILFGIFVLAIFIPALAVQVRRFHDQDRSGWFVLLNFIPYVGGLIVLVFMVLEGTRGPNRFGPDPKDPYAEDDVVETFG
ncbi:DUF805 domain-containing protein [Sphingomonas sp. FW199]|uniref:DUF805 domain-containing protein n=1 Tax=Sphingomonas sp. FW199 TaxID=3400217 RepID=UPI003CE95C29